MSSIGVVPLLWLTRRREKERAYWWLAVALGISFLADTVAHWYDPWQMGFAYSVLQCALIGFVFLWRQEAFGFLSVLTATALFATWWQGNVTLVVSVAWLGVVGIVWDRPALGTLRTALLVIFGLGWVLWLLYAKWPGWWTWGGYQATRLLGTLLFCYAVAREKPVLRLA